MSIDLGREKGQCSLENLVEREWERNSGKRSSWRKGLPLKTQRFSIVHLDQLTGWVCNRRCRETEAVGFVALQKQSVMAAQARTRNVMIIYPHLPCGRHKTQLNPFNILRVNYEVFHTRMLGWLFSPTAEHKLSDAGLRVLFGILEIEGSVNSSVNESVNEEVQIQIPNSNKLRVADLVVRTDRYFVLLENKVDPEYQDVQQLIEEAEAGRSQAASENREFKFVLIAPGPLHRDVGVEFAKLGGFFVSWTTLVQHLRGIPLESAERETAWFIEQYFDFVDERCDRKASLNLSDAIYKVVTMGDAEKALQKLITELPAGTTTNVSELWSKFEGCYPDIVLKFSEPWANNEKYTAKAWFASTLQRYASEGIELEDSWLWVPAAPGWGYTPVKSYRRVSTMPAS
ncbi:MAG: PD-(D/E)XK nuclease family protein [Planctomycetaceae bacterium]